jgi:hypothetical protein
MLAALAVTLLWLGWPQSGRFPSPDGKYVVETHMWSRLRGFYVRQRWEFEAEAMSVYLRDRTSGERQRLLEEGGSDATFCAGVDARWSPDARFFTVTLHQAGDHVFDATFQYGLPARGMPAVKIEPTG